MIFLSWATILLTAILISLCVVGLAFVFWRIFHWKTIICSGFASILWFLMSSGATYLGYTLVEQEATRNHTRNIGIPLIFGAVWVFYSLLASLAGLLLSAIFLRRMNKTE